MATLEPPHLQPGPPLKALQGQDSNTAAATASTSKHEDPSPKATLGFISQASCYLHRYTRNDSDAHIVERADRLRSVFMGVAVAHGRFKATKLDKGKGREDVKVSEDISDLEKLLGGMNIAASKDIAEGWPFSISSVSRTLPLQSAAVDFAHGPDYSQKLLSYISDVAARHANKESEVPEPLSQGDLYLCQESLQALEGALGACCEGVDQICQDRTSVGARRFVSIRPPGHHCESENPMGFCWLNNVAVAAAHAHLEHGIDRVIVFDIDLHHGNGTQEIAWRLNSMAHKAIYARQKPPSPRKQSPKKPVPAAIPPKPALQVFYGSLHDVDSYPCEDMDPTLIANASVNISGGGGSQYITNVHLEPYDDHLDFHERLYPLYQARLMNSAHAFLQKTKAVAKNTLVIISAGFDASEHEYASMSRHGARVPTSFFSQFARDAVSFAGTEAEGKLLAVLEGGYSQRALASGAGSFVSGLMDVEDLSRETLDSWWSSQNLEVYEKALAPPTSRGKRGAISPSKAASSGESDWRGPALAIFSKLIETLPSKPIPAKSKEKNVTPPSSNVRTTRSRYCSPAQPVKLNGETNSSAEPQQKVVPVKTEEVPLETPITSPLIARQNPSSVFPPATPVIRFTFKAAENKLQQPDVFAGQYQDATSGTEPSGSDGKSDSSD